MMIAITGASGFLGGHLARDLNSRKIPNRCLVRSVPSQGLNQNLSSFVLVDYDNQSSVDAALSGCDVLVHFLGLINGTEELLHQVNVDYSRKILEAAKKAGIRRIVWVSSVAALRRHGYYGITKFEGEELLRASGIPFTILQPAFIYGFGDENNTAMLIQTLRRYPIVPLLGGGDFKLQPVYVDDVMRLIQSVLNDVPQDRAYIVAGPEQISLKSMLQLLAIELKKKPLFLPLPLKPIQAMVRIYFKLFPRTKLPAKQILELDKHEAFDISATTQKFQFNPRPFSAGVQAMFKQGSVCAA